MLKIIISETSKGYLKIRIDTERLKIMDKYSQLKRFHHDRVLQVYMHAFMYVDPDTIPVQDRFTATKTFVENYKNI